MDTIVYAARIKNIDDLYKSSSGGLFTAITNLFISNGDYILSSIYNYKTQRLEFKIYNDVSSRDAARGSKYFKSEIGTTFKDAVTLLKNNPQKRLLFVGMGCQADGFENLCELSRIRDRVYIVDIICTGNPSSKVWKSFISRYGDVSYITFKDKRNGWYKPSAIAISNGEEVSIEEWLKIFYKHNADKPACAECPFARTERKVDIAIGDFWNIEHFLPDFFDQNGNAVVLVHTKKGLELFDSIKDELDFCESDLKSCWQNRLYTAPGKPVTRSAFWRDYNKHGIEYVLRKYEKMPLWGKIITRISHVKNKHLRK